MRVLDLFCSERRDAMRPDKPLLIRCLVLGFFITFPFFLCSFMEVAR